MKAIYLFDWGDTLMVDFPGVTGKMCDWDVVEAVDGAAEALSFLSQKGDIYIATGAAESTEADIRVAFKRVGLDRYISGYFCKANLGISKGNTDFFSAILEKLNVQPDRITMVGDSLENDINPALAANIRVIWLAENNATATDSRVRRITSLRELCL